MLEEYREQERRKTSKMKATMDYIMGSLVIFIGILFLLYDELGMKKIFLGKEHSFIDYIIGSVFVLYGAWRIYRGYKKNYYQ